MYGLKSKKYFSPLSLILLCRDWEELFENIYKFRRFFFAVDLHPSAL